MTQPAKPATLLYVGQESDRTYTPKLKSYVGNATVYVKLMPAELTVAEITLYCKSKGITGVFTNHPALLKKLTHKDKPSLANFAGSMFFRDGIEFLIISPLEHLWTVKHGAFMMRRFLSKLVAPHEWLPEPEFDWQMITPANYYEVFTVLDTAILTAVDIETTKHNLGISHCGYAAVVPSAEHPSGFIIKSFVLKVEDMWAVSAMRNLNITQSPKVLQNGKYDIAYFFRYNAPLYNFLYDTAVLFHSWYAELPKDLAYLSAFFIRTSVYWKDMTDGADDYTYCMYNAKDIHATAVVFMRMLNEAPEWAVRNYLQKFPMVFPSHMCEMRGIKRDRINLKEVSTKVNDDIAAANTRLSRILGAANFNVNSPKQMKQLLKVLGCGDLESADEKHLEKAAYRHPLNRFIVDIILDIRGWRKLASTYLVEGKEFHDATLTTKPSDRILYAITPYGTDTGRNSSSESSFWCGLQIQNIPRGPEVKSTLIADDGFRLFEADLEQAESRDTAFIAGDVKLIEAVTGTRDFHSVNCSSFFGVPYESIYDDATGKTKNKALRDIAKRVNHGANYNMGANTLVATMTEVKVREAGRLLGLPVWWSAKEIAQHLLDAFHKTYPSLQGTYYPSVVHEIVTTQLLSSKAKHIAHSDSLRYDAVEWYKTGGWTRRCFGDPVKNKLDLNSYVAHGPQSLNAMTLDKAMMRVFYEIALHPQHSQNFKLLAQIHDSIFFQVRIGHEYIAEIVKQAMEIPVTVKGCDGKERTFTVPSAIKGGKDKMGAIRWSETE